MLVLEALHDGELMLLNAAKRANGLYRRGEFARASDEYLKVRQERPVLQQAHGYCVRPPTLCDKAKARDFTIAWPSSQ